MSSCANIRKKNLDFDNINFYCEALKILIAQQLLIACVTSRHKDSASHRSFKSLALDFVLIRQFQISKHFEVLVLLSRDVIKSLNHKNQNWEPNEPQKYARKYFQFININSDCALSVWRKTWPITTKQQFLKVRLLRIFQVKLTCYKKVKKMCVLRLSIE